MSVKNAVKKIPVIGPLARGVVNAFRGLRQTEFHRLNLKLDDLAAKVEELRSSAVSCYLGDHTILTRVKNFLMFIHSDDLGMTPSLLLCNVWEPWVSNTFERLIRPGMTVLDIGANIGYFTLVAGRAVGPTGKVYAFEPEPRNFETLKRNCFVNGLNWATPVNKALWNQAGTMKLNLSTRVNGGHSLVFDIDDGNPKRSIAVETVRLDDFLESDRHVDVIKMDAEGAEPEILEGMPIVLRTNPDLKIIMEFSPSFVRRGKWDPVQYVAWLKELGFSVRVIEHDESLTPVDIHQIKDVKEWMEMLLLERAS